MTVTNRGRCNLCLKRVWTNQCKQSKICSIKKDSGFFPAVPLLPSIRMSPEGHQYSPLGLKLRDIGELIWGSWQPANIVLQVKLFESSPDYNINLGREIPADLYILFWSLAYTSERKQTPAFPWTSISCLPVVISRICINTEKSCVFLSVFRAHFLLTSVNISAMHTTQSTLHVWPGQTQEHIISLPSNSKYVGLENISDAWGILWIIWPMTLVNGLRNWNG